MQQRIVYKMILRPILKYLLNQDSQDNQAIITALFRLLIQEIPWLPWTAHPYWWRIDAPDEA